MNNELLPLPIGTRLITNNLEIAAGLVKRFGSKDIESEVFYYNCPKKALVKGLVVGGHLDRRYHSNEKWEIIVTTDNQKLLSDTPIIGDKIERGMFDCQNGITQMILSEKDILRAVTQSDYVNIISRFYPFADKNLTPITTSMVMNNART
jgi:hypothetical protein